MEQIKVRREMMNFSAELKVVNSKWKMIRTFKKNFPLTKVLNFAEFKGNNSEK